MPKNSTSAPPPFRSTSATRKKLMAYWKSDELFSNDIALMRQKNALKSYYGNATARNGPYQWRIFIIRSPSSRDHYSILFFNRLQIFMTREILIFPSSCENFTENFNTFGRLVCANRGETFNKEDWNVLCKYTNINKSLKRSRDAFFLISSLFSF